MSITPFVSKRVHGYEWDDPVPNEGVGEDIPEPLRRKDEPDDGDPDATPFIERYERTEE